MELGDEPGHMARDMIDLYKELILIYRHLRDANQRVAELERRAEVLSRIVDAAEAKFH